jgi:predicted HTH transcriptional regulator
MGLALPESELLRHFKEEEHVLIYVLLGILGLGIVSVILLARQYEERLQEIQMRPKYSEASEEDIRALIREGEQERLEFKSTLRWNLKAKKVGNKIIRAWLKTLVAFLNTDGGTLLIGVRDDGEILGTEADQFPNEDKFLLHFNNLIKQHVGLEHAAHIFAAIRSVEDKRILVVDCERSLKPVFLRFGDEEEFFVRVGSGTRRLPPSKVLEYIKARASG